MAAAGVDPSDRDVLVVSMRGCLRTPGYSSWYEFEDLLQTWENAELLELPYDFDSSRFRLPRIGYKLLRKAHLSEEAALRAAWSEKLGTPAKHQYDLIVIVISSYFDMFIAHRLRSLLSPNGKLVGIAIEIWPSEVDQPATDIEPLGLFDSFYVALLSGAEKLNRHVGNVSGLAPAGDVLSGIADGKDRLRSIALVNPGRRSELQHRVLVRASETDGRPYLYDTLGGGLASKPTVHRSLYNRLLQQSEMIVCNYAKFDQGTLIAGEREVPARLFEGMAAGNVLIGDSPSPEALARSGVEAARIVKLGLDGEGVDVPRILQDRDFLDSAGLENQILAASAHDWGHRWSSVLNDLDLAQPAALKSRLAMLAQFATSTGQRVDIDLTKPSAAVPILDR